MKIQSVKGPIRLILKTNKDPGSKDTRVFYFQRRMMDKLDYCGCDCDQLSVEPKWNTFLTEEDFRRMIDEKAARARRQREMMIRLDGQLETD